jgi:hypothetical protein
MQPVMTVPGALARPHTRSDYGVLEFSLVTFFFSRKRK